jgi:hypothetical protein
MFYTINNSDEKNLIIIGFYILMFIFYLCYDYVSHRHSKLKKISSNQSRS